jgi:hypothetical protein
VKDAITLHLIVSYYFAIAKYITIACLFKNKRTICEELFGVNLVTIFPQVTNFGLAKRVYDLCNLETFCIEDYSFRFLTKFRKSCQDFLALQLFRSYVSKGIQIVRCAAELRKTFEVGNVIS